MSEQLTPEWLAEKRRIAEAATPGPWTADAGYIVVLGSDGWAEKRVACLDIDGNSMDDEFIAAFDPPTVLAMLDEIERLRREWETLIPAILWFWSKDEIELHPPGVGRAFEALQRIMRTCKTLALFGGAKDGGGS